MPNAVHVLPHQTPAFRYAILGVAPVATPTDFIIIQGSNQAASAIKRIALDGVATAAGNMPAQLVRRSIADATSGVLTAIAASKHDMRDPDPKVVVSTVGTANFSSLGTSQGVMGAGRIQFSAAGTGVAANLLVWDFGPRMSKSIVLRGALDFLCVNLNGAALPAGGLIDIDIEIEEALNS